MEPKGNALSDSNPDYRNTIKTVKRSTFKRDKTQILTTVGASTDIQSKDNIMTSPFAA